MNLSWCHTVLSRAIWRQNVNDGILPHFMYFYSEFKKFTPVIPSCKIFSRFPVVCFAGIRSSTRPCFQMYLKRVKFLMPTFRKMQLLSTVLPGAGAKVYSLVKYWSANDMVHIGIPKRIQNSHIELLWHVALDAACISKNEASVCRQQLIASCTILQAHRLFTIE